MTLRSGPYVLPSMPAVEGAGFHVRRPFPTPNLPMVDPFRRWHDRGLRPAAGSDAPVSSDDPLIGLHVMVTRKTDRGRVLGSSESLPLAEALHTYTANGAYSAFAEAERGLPASLQPVLDIGECGKETMVVFVVACQGLDPIQKREIASATYSVQ